MGQSKWDERTHAHTTADFALCSFFPLGARSSRGPAPPPFYGNLITLPGPSVLAIPHGFVLSCVLCCERAARFVRQGNACPLGIQPKHPNTDALDGRKRVLKVYALGVRPRDGPRLCAHPWPGVGLQVPCYDAANPP